MSRKPTQAEIERMAVAFWHGYPPPADLVMGKWWDRESCQAWFEVVSQLLSITNGAHNYGGREAA